MITCDNMGFIKKINRKDKKGSIKTYYYYYEYIKLGGKWVQKYVRQATPEEVAATHNEDKKDIAIITCANPDCDNQIKMPRSQKRRLYTTYPLRYNRFQMVYCSEACQQIHDMALRG